MCHRYKALRRRSLAIAAVGLALCLAVPASAKPPSWDKKIEGKGRFKVLKAFDEEAVLDKETGLVWARVAVTLAIARAEMTQVLPAPGWVAAMQVCQYQVIGDRGGWRLPRFEELTTIVNPRNGDLPAAHPFDAPEGHYHTATTLQNVDGADSTTAWLVAVGDLSPGLNVAVNKSAEDDGNGVWCVRGGAGIDDQ